VSDSEPSKYATVRLAEFATPIPLIGVPFCATQEKCDRCGEEFHLSEVALDEHGKPVCAVCSEKGTQTKMSKPRMYWKKGKLRDGQTRLAETYRLHRDGAKLAIAQRMGQASSQWFWYGDGINTASRPASLAECKAEAFAHFKQKEAKG
jgi:hypothetical protein